MKKIFLSVVTAISVTMVSQAQFKTWFTKQEEGINYELYKRDIEVTQFDTTGTKLFMESKVEDNSTLLTNHRNRVAVMPMTYIGLDNESRTEEMRYYLQGIAIEYLSKSGAGLKILDAMEVNASLRKKGINDFNLREYTPGELARILNVEYVVMGTVLQDLGRGVTVFHGNRNRERVEHRSKEIRRRGRDNLSGSYVTRQNIETRVSFYIYNETSYKIYSCSRQSILSGPGAYQNTIQYLLKRSPLYNR